LLDLSFEQPFFLMVMRDFLKNLRMLQLGFQDILLVTLAYAVACFRRLFHLIQKIVTLLQNAKRLLDVGQLEVNHLEIPRHRSPN